MMNRRNPNMVASKYNAEGGITDTITTYYLGHAETAFVEMAIDGVTELPGTTGDIKKALLEMLRLTANNSIRVTIEKIDHR